MTEEKEIMSSDNGLIKLTNRKIRYTSESFGKANIVSIMLNEISAIEVYYKSYLPALLLGILFILLGLILGVQNQGDALLALLILGVIFIIYYLMTRRHVVSIISNSGRAISFQSSGMRRETLLKFIDKVEKAKYEYDKKAIENI